ncbi:type I restriction enzyme HsdR N-terminal domain-containing protein [Cereibacter sphaeroides]|uniref:type I restriction endonuclease n=1 Tax=Cereibacter sphaeroides TaxID=1063 RepID=UPI001F34E2F2|nr:type I restriction endonuclease [Cereibacter sphaeroides]MCE6960253.1 type I restriction enzyme HsdR N-terminal domain-containing protein [Cereibacter sphaeroides]MCE6974864.1 type I restriction enzyme HsdR N-terminal domain-containing protein [Cereibacter sphaeroides]
MADFLEQIATLSTRSKVAERQALTEEATKTAVVLPFLQALGFDVFNLEEVMPEFIADVGMKKGEKVDFAIKIDGKIAMLVEAKPINSKLGETQFSQLFRYFHVTEARLAILTNGREAWFFSDTDEPNKMDKRPFFKFDFQNYDNLQVQELARFQKGCFAIESIIEAASNLKYTRAAASYLKGQLDAPDDDFIRLIGRQIHDGSITKAVAEQLKPAIQAALDEIIRDRIQDKLSITLRGDPPAAKNEPAPEVEEPELETTDEEREGFMIVRAIAAKIAPIERITMRDAKSYCAILMDDNNRRPVCRLYFNSPTTKNIGLFSADKVETKIRVDKPSDLYKHTGAIEAAIQSYLGS